jgi:hypothetical protein
VGRLSSRVKGKGLGGGKYVPMSWNETEEFIGRLWKGWDCSMSYLKVCPLTDLEGLDSV